MADWDEVVHLVRRLRSPGGCPWDRVQTHRTLRRYALEEAREVVAAIDEGDAHALAAELGDLLLQVVLHAVIAQESGAFGPDDVLAALADKLVRRHPHVFGTAQAGTPEEALRNWEALKRAERGSAPAGLLDDVSRALPALAEAHQLGKRAAEVGFDWESPRLAWRKVEEETAELLAAWRSRERAEAAGASAGDGCLEALAEEMGDVLFALANVARLLGLDPEGVLVATNDKFRRRFGAVEAGARAQGRPVGGLAPEEMDALWQAAKGAGR